MFISVKVSDNRRILAKKKSQTMLYIRQCHRRVVIRITSCVLVSLVLAVPGLLLAKDLTVPIDRLGPYKLGMSLADAKKLPEFTIDEKRSEPDKGIIAGRIIGKLFDKVTVQRSFFNQNGLFRATIIFGDSKVTEDDVKAIVAAEWGDPGPKVEVGDTKNYIWKGTNACFILIVTGDEGRVLVSIACQGS